MHKKEKYIVTIDRPDGVSVRNMVEYIEDAVGCMCGGYNPLDPIFDLESNSVKAKRLIEKNREK